MLPVLALWEFVGLLPRTAQSTKLPCAGVEGEAALETVKNPERKYSTQGRRICARAHAEANFQTVPPPQIPSTGPEVEALGGVQGSSDTPAELPRSLSAFDTTHFSRRPSDLARAIVLPCLGRRRLASAAMYE